MKYFAEDKDDLYSTVFAELKCRGVKVPKVKKFKSQIPKQEGKEKSTVLSKSKLFGISLNDQEWISDDEYILPKFIASSTIYLKKHSKEIGLFRKAGSIARQRDLRAKLENGGSLEGSEPNDVASLLKQWLRELPEPLIPHHMHDLFVRCQQIEDDEKRLTSILLTCLLLPPDHLHTLKHLFHFLSEFAADSDKNKMGAHNLALIMTPNIFVLGTDSVDKTSNNLVQQQTAVIQLLIENAEKIGEIPSSVSFQQQSIQDFKSCSELDSSGDLLDCSPCVSKKKKRSGGPVQDIFSGIRKKLVGQNATPATASKLDTPEKFWNPRTPLPRSASKRKADAEQQASSAIKKQATSTGEDATVIETPKNKGTANFLTVNGKSGGNHTRKKSFGLLRRKERKRQKSSSSSSVPKGSLSFKNPSDSNTAVYNNRNSEATNEVLGKENDCAFVLTSPVFNFCPENVLKMEGIKKSTSDCYLTTPCKDSVFLSTSSSHGCLPVKRKTSPYNLRSDKKASENSLSTPNQGGLFVGVPLNLSASRKRPSPLSKVMVSNVSKDAKAMSCKYPEIEKSSPNNQVHLLVTGEPYKVGSEPKRRSLQEGGSRKRSLSKPNLDLKQTQLEKGQKAGKDYATSEFSLQSKVAHVTGKRSPNADLRSSQRSGITRQEAFIVKSKKKLKESLEQMENPRNSNRMNKCSLKNKVVKDETECHPLRKSQSVSLEVEKKHKSSKKVTKKTIRNGSIVRGRPNTVKTGLYQRSNADTNSTPNAQNSRNNKDKIDLSVCSSKQHEDAENQSMNINEDSIFADLLDMSLNLKFEHFSLTSTSFTFEEKPKTDVLIIPDYDTVVPSCSKNTTPKQKRSTELNVSLKPITRSEKRLSLQIDHNKRVSSHSDSKIPRLRSSVEIVRNNSFSEPVSDPKRKVPKCRRSDIIDCEKTPSSIPVICRDGLNDLSSLQVSMNDSCFKTPNAKLSSPVSEVWVSASKFLGFQTPQEEKGNNKRESIAMILKSQPGHVQAKVSMYDTKVRDSVYYTRSVPSYSTPTVPFSDLSARDKAQMSSQKKRSGSQKGKKQLSCSTSCDSTRKVGGRSYRSPLPPPPKFMMTPSPNTSHPLKEVTNISFTLNGSRNSPNNSLLKDDNSSLKSAKEINSKKQLKLKRNSFSGNTPQKRSKKVSRSESSPYPRPHNRVTRLKEESTSGNQLLVFEKDYWKESLPVKPKIPRTPVSKSDSSSSLVKFRCDQMIDEWQCEM